MHVKKLALSIKVDKTDKVGDRRNVNSEGSCRDAVRSFSGIPARPGEGLPSLPISLSP